MSAQHTPGPWRTRKDDNNFLLVLQNGDKDATWPAIAAIDLEEWGHDRNEAHANLQLIAAAPELLRTLTNLINATNVNADELDPLTVFVAIEQAKGAIAKATGDV